MGKEKPSEKSLVPKHKKSILKKSVSVIIPVEAPPPRLDLGDDADYIDEDAEENENAYAYESDNEEDMDASRQESQLVTFFQKRVLRKMKPLSEVFKQFAKQKNMWGEPAINLTSILEWFEMANVFGAIQLTPHDVTVMFNRMGKETLNASQINEFFDSLVTRRNFHADTLAYRLKLCVKPEYDKQLFHVSLPEGSVDRVIDAFRDIAQFVEQRFFDCSDGDYTEEICTGGIRHHSREDMWELEEDMAKTQKLRGIEKKYSRDPIFENFTLFAKNQDYKSDGRNIGLVNLMKWMKQADVFAINNLSVTDAVYLYKQMFSLEARLYIPDLKLYLKELGLWKGIANGVLLDQMQCCDAPAQQSITLVHMRLPLSASLAMADMLGAMSRKYDEDSKEYIPNSEDKPSGHTQLSRDRFFLDKVEGRDIKIQHKEYDEEEDRKTKSATYQKYLRLKAEREDGKAEEKRKKSAALFEINDDDEKGAAKNRAKKTYFTQRWDGAYPYGGHEKATRPIRLDPNIQRYLNSVRVPRKRSSAEILTDKERRLLAGPNRLARVDFSKQFQPVSFPEQFQKFCQFRSKSKASELTPKNMESWLIQAHILDGQAVTLKDVRQAYKKYREFKTFDIETLTTILTVISRKKRLSLVEVIERLCRCGPPQVIDIEKMIEKTRPPDTTQTQQRKTSVATGEERRTSIVQPQQQRKTSVSTREERRTSIAQPQQQRKPSSSVYEDRRVSFAPPGSSSATVRTLSVKPAVSQQRKLSTGANAPEVRKPSIKPPPGPPVSKSLKIPSKSKSQQRKLSTSAAAREEQRKN